MATFYVAKDNTTGLYVSGYTAFGGPTYTSDVLDAVWSYQSSSIDAYITDHNIQNATTTEITTAGDKTGGGDHPRKPPLP